MDGAFLLRCLAPRGSRGILPRVDKLVGAQRPMTKALEVIGQRVELKADQWAAIGEVLATY